MEWKTILGLMVLYFVYLLGGAGVFWALEYKREEKVCHETQAEIKEILAQFETPPSRLVRSGDHFNKTDLDQLLRLMLTAADNGVVFDKENQPHCAHNWCYNSAFFFAGTVVTTIGYGNISPKTAEGKIFCIIYAFLGIPLFGMMFLGIGEKAASLVHRLNAKIEVKMVKRKRLRQIVVLLVSIFVLHVFFLILPALVFSYVEEWSYRDAIYYTYITLTTIGLGDFVVGSNPDISYPTVYRVAVYFWILFGLAVMATLISLVSDFYKPAAKTKELEESTQVSVAVENLKETRVEL